MPITVPATKGSIVTRAAVAGLVVGAGSDWGPKNPFEQMQLAETHEFAGSGRPVGRWRRRYCVPPPTTPPPVLPPPVFFGAGAGAGAVCLGADWTGALWVGALCAGAVA